MAEDTLSRPRFFMDEEKNRAFLKDLEERRSHVPSAAERQSAAAIKSVLDEEDEEDMESCTTRDAEQPTHVVDLGPDLSNKATIKPARSFWEKLQTGWSGVEDRLVEFFGLEQSKYQWAVDEFVERQLAGDIPRPKTNADGLQLQEIQEQTMQRDLEAPKS